MLPGRTFAPEDIGKIILRHRWLILLPFAVGLASAPLIGKRIQEVYKSETLIMVIPQRVPDSYVRSTVTASIGDRLPSISDQILSRSRLERVINDFDLYKSLRAIAPMEDVVRQMREDIGTPIIQPGAQSFRVSYTSPDPITAQKVTARLASLFIDENSRDRETQAESTNVFLESQLEDAKRRLLEHEKKLEEYRRLHAGELPSQLDSNLRAIQTAQLQLQSINDAMNRGAERRLGLERQLADAQTSLAAEAPITATTSATSESTPMSAAQMLDQAQRNLEALRLKYTADHPDVRKLERMIVDLKDRTAEEASRPLPPPPAKAQSPAEIARQKRIRDLQADMEILDRQLSASEREQARLKAIIEEYQQKVDVVPKRESELVELTRDYDILKKTYDGLLTKREDSKLAANLERRQIGEQFRILDPASLPVRPSNQIKRLGFSFAGAGLGLISGLLLVALLEYRDSSLRQEQDVTRILELPVLALVPVMRSNRGRRRHRIKRFAIEASAVIMLLGSTAVVVAWGLGQL